MLKYKLWYYLSKSCSIFIALLIFSCKENKTRQVKRRSPVDILTEFKNLPTEKLTELKFKQDTFLFKLPSNSDTIRKKITGTNIGKVAFQVGRIEASCTCTKISFDKKVIKPKDSLVIDLLFLNQHKPFGSFFTIIGNIPDGYKIVYARFK